MTDESLYLWPDLPRKVPKRRNTPGSNRVMVGRKFCSCCGRWRHVIDFDAYARTERGVPLQFQSRCQACAKAKNRIRNGGTKLPRKIGKPTAEEKRAYNRASYHRRRQDPAYLEYFREGQRIYLEAKRREAGIKPRVWGPKSKRGDKTDPLIDNTSLRDAVLSCGLTISSAATRIGWLDANGKGDERRLSRSLGLSPDRGVYRQRIHYSHAKLIVQALGIDPVDAGI